MIMNNVVTALVNDDKIESVSGTYEFDSLGNAASYYTFLTVFEEYSDPKISLGIELKDTVITVTNFHYLLESGMDNISLIGEDKDNYIRILESKNYSCD